MNTNKFLEKIANLDGVKNKNDIYDLETFEEIMEQIGGLLPNVREELDETELSEETKECLNITRKFCADLSEHFKKEFLDLLGQYRKEKREISDKIIEYLREKQFDLPKFALANGEKAQGLLNDFNLSEKIDDKNLLLSFQLPKPLAQFWWKGGEDADWGSRAEAIEGAAIEWGHFYRELMPVVWGMQGYYEDEKGLFFWRLNDISQHDPEKYYYVWEMSY